MYSVRALGASSLLLIALANAFSFFAAVASAINISGGHVNPAITLGALVGGRLSLVRAIYYWLGQLLGAVIASLLLRFSTDGMVYINLPNYTSLNIRNLNPQFFVRMTGK